jgi:hypothetical protein
LQLRLVADRKISGSTKGRRTFALNTDGLPPQQAGEPLRLAVGEDQRVVVGAFATVGDPQPRVRVAADDAGPALDLDEEEARRRQDQRVDLVDLAFLVDELEVGPGVPGLAIGKMIAKPVQRLALPGELVTGKRPASD